MIPANTIYVSQEGPANALALNKDRTQVVIAGRNVFKVFSIEENEFTEVCNLRVGKNLNLNFSSIDVAWSSIEENTLATAATNGAVVVWNLSRSGRSEQEHVFSDHKRTVNKVSFHLTDPSLLISGSQDGMMKCFDLRMKEVARTFISNTESIRDVQFNPHAAHSFAAVSENGNVQVWDVRRHERPLQQFTAHSGPVFACDWHPEIHWLATASRDKTIKVWDIHAKPNLEYTIYTIASVGHVKWRPQKKYQVASCALVLDCAVHVWDVRRPHVPLATFAEHRDVTTAIVWLGDPNVFLSTSRDCSLYRHRWSEAAHPVLWANPQGVCVSARMQIAHAAPERPLPVLPLNPPRVGDARPLGPGRKQPTAGSLTGSAQAQLEQLFPGGGGSVLRRWSTQPDPLVQCAKEYKLRGAPPHELAKHNATVALNYKRHMVSHLWEVVRSVYGEAGAGRGGRHAATNTHAHAHPPRASPPRAPLPPPLPLYSAVEEEPLEEVEEWAETQFHNNGVLGMPTHSIYIPPAKYAKQLMDDESAGTSGFGGAGWVSAASAHYVDVDAADWTLPEEAFPLRAAPAPHPPHTPVPQQADPDINAPANPPSSSSSGGSSSSPGAASASSGSGSHAHAPPALSPTHSRMFLHQSSVISLEGEEGGEYAGASAGTQLSVRCGAGGEARRGGLDMAPLLAAALRHHADLGDVQTSAVVLIVLQEHRSDVTQYIEESLQEQWLLGYIELLQRNKLWNVATEVIRCAWLSSVWQLSQRSTSVAVSCGRCSRRTRPHAACDRCQPRHMPDTCSVCHQVVRGLYAWCQGCSHGGHLHHMHKWMQQHQLCPAGCGHYCQLG